MSYDAEAERLVWEKATGWKVRRREHCAVLAIFGRHRGGCCHYSGGSAGRLNVIDHPYAVKRARDDSRALLAMPYGLSSSGATLLTEWAATHGIRWYVDSQPGWWFPGTISLFLVSDGL